MTPCAVLLGLFSLQYLGFSRKVTGEQRKGGNVGLNLRDGTLQ